MKSKFVIGDKVEIINYGHLIWSSKKSEIEIGLPVIHEGKYTIWYDMNNDIVGKIGVVDDVTETQGNIQYSLKGIPQKSAWYNEDQLKIVSANVNRD